MLLLFFFGLNLAEERAICNFLLPPLTSNIRGGTPLYEHPYIRTVSFVVTNQISINPKLSMLPRGVVPKKGGIWCLITDISSLLGSSIYYYIPKEAFTLHYATFHQALSLAAHHHGPHGQTWSNTPSDTDLTSLPGELRTTQHPVAGQLLHRSLPPLWLAIPFLAPCPYFCNLLADAFEWLLKNNYHIQDLMHESDNYFTVGSPNSSVCAQNVATIPDVASQVGIPLPPYKLVGPTTRLVFLSILTLLAESEFLPPTSNVISINIGLKTALYYA